MFEPTKRGFERGSFRGTLRADAVVPSTLRPVFHRPVCRDQPSSLQTPRVPLKITNEIDFGPIWGPFKVPRQRCGPMGCALGHRSSSFRRTGTVYGGLDTSHELSFDTCHQRGHQVKSSWSPLSSRDLGSNWSFSVHTSPGRCTVRRQFFGSVRSTAAQIPLVSCLSSHATSKGIK